MLQESQRQLIRESEFTVVVFGKGEDFVLLRCNGDDNDYQHDLLKANDAGERGMAFCGVLALADDGQLKADISPTNPAAVYTMMFAGLAFVHLVADRLKAQAKNDSAEWLTRLFLVPDTRD
jgi:murein tripeptide amidase MpaA